MTLNKEKTKTQIIRETKELIRRGNPAKEQLLLLLESPHQEVRQLIAAFFEKTRLEDERLENMLLFERTLWSRGINLVAGIDEAGRGPLAGPVAAAAVILSPDKIKSLSGLDDSKKLSPKKRYELEAVIKKNALYWAVSWQNQRQIDRYNILQATKISMIKAVKKLPVKPEYLLIDALRLEKLSIDQDGIIKGDQKSLSIAAASVLAKCWRDRLMDSFHEKYPQYDFIKHKGYPTAEHRGNLALYGPSVLHRRSFIVKGGK